MKQYVIDQLREYDYSQILVVLKSKAEKSAFDDIFWVDLPKELYSEVQAEHAECQPYYFAVSLEMTRIEFEFLIRSRQKLRCSCVSYATRAQKDYIIDFADNLLDDLKIKV